MPLEDKKHRSVILFSEWKKPLRSLSLEQKGLILDALLDFPDGRRPDFEDPLLAMAWEFMEGGLEANAKKWDEIRERRSDSGRKGAEKRWKRGGKETGSDSKNGKCHNADGKNSLYVSVSDSVSVSGSDSASGYGSVSDTDFVSSSSSSDDGDPDDDDQTTTHQIVNEFESCICKLSANGKAELNGYAERLGPELVQEILSKCIDLGARSWAYVRRALAEAEAQGCKSVEEYRLTNPIGAGRNMRVDRIRPSGNDILANATRRRPLIKPEAAADGLEQNLRRLKKKEAAKEGTPDVPEP